MIAFTQVFISQLILLMKLQILLICFNLYAYNQPENSNSEDLMQLLIRPGIKLLIYIVVNTKASIFISY